MDLEFLKKLKDEYETQDNRCTSYPIYVAVQELKCIGVAADGYSYGDDSEVIEEFPECDTCDSWVGDCAEDQEKKCVLDKIPMLYLWTTVEFFLTLKGAEEYMKTNAHNHGKLRTYVKWFETRNFEMRSLLKAIDIEKVAGR